MCKLILFSLIICNCYVSIIKITRPIIYQNLLTLPISGGSPLNELFERFKTNRLNLHASSGYSFSCEHTKSIHNRTDYLLLREKRTKASEAKMVRYL
jgi:hypothetical protein